jgi:hypothetical protein
MRKLTLLFFLLVATLSLQAQQRIQAYLNAGTTLSQVEGDELKGFSHLGFTGGVGAWIHLDDRDRWALAVETDYNCRGIANHKSSSENYYNIQLDLHYVDIPVTLFFHDPYGGLQIGLGMVYSRLVAQPHGTVFFNPNFFIPDSSDMKFLKDDLAPAIEMRFTVWQNLKLSVRYQRSIIAIKKGWTFKMGDETWSNDCYNSSVSIRLAWQFGEENIKTHKKRRR